MIVDLLACSICGERFANARGVRSHFVYCRRRMLVERVERPERHPCQRKGCPVDTVHPSRTCAYHGKRDAFAD